MWWILLLLTLPCWSQPSPPQQPPPGSAASQEAPVPQRGLAQIYQLKAGWNPLSFPFRKIIASQGIEWVIDPKTGLTLSPLQCQPGQGYWYYTPEKSQASVWGDPLEESCAIELQPGWNLVGSPDYDPLRLFQITASDDTQNFRILEEICPTWLDPYQVSSDHGKQPLNATSEWQPGAAYWLFANRPMRLHVSASARVPLVSRYYPGDDHEQVIEGEHFGSRDSGRLIVGRETLAAPDIIEWTPTKIRYRVGTPDAPPTPPTPMPLEPSPLQKDHPATPPSERVVVVAGAAASPRLLDRSLPGPDARFSLKVLSEDNQPVPRASIWVDGAYAGISDVWGRVPLSPLEPGLHRIRVSCHEFLTRELNWQVAAGRTTTPQITLYSPRSSIWVRATPCAGGFRPYKIEIYQKSNNRLTTYNTWYYNQATPYVDLIWNAVPTNLIYRIDITWRDANHYEKYLRVERKLPRYGLRLTFYNYWGPAW